MKKSLPGTGWKRQEKDDRDYTTDHPKVKYIYAGIRLITLPSAVDLREFCTPVEDQGNLGSCTAHSAIGAMEYLDNKADKVYFDRSRLFTYYDTRDKEGTLKQGDVGATIRGSIKSLKETGTPNELLWPYNVSEFNKKPDTPIYTEARKHKALTYISLSGLDEIKQSLYAGIPVDIGFDCYESIWDSEAGPIPYPSSGESLEGGHAILLVGYDDTKKITNSRNRSTTTGAFLFRNSWGTGWGEAGYGWLPYKYITNGKADDFWAVLTIEDDTPTPEPEPTPEPSADEQFEEFKKCVRELLEAVHKEIGDFLEKSDGG